MSSSKLEILYSPEISRQIISFPKGTKVWWDGGKLTPEEPSTPAPCFIAQGDHLVPFKKVPVPQEKLNRSLRTGDVVLHRPSGETWTVAWVNSHLGLLSPCGWPTCEARVADCDFISEVTDGQMMNLIFELLDSGRSDASKAFDIFCKELADFEKRRLIYNYLASSPRKVLDLQNYHSSLQLIIRKGRCFIALDDHSSGGEARPISQELANLLIDELS